jgi:hypothetical protein
MLKALILNVRLENAKDWDSSRDHITNKLGQKIDVKTITKSTITLIGDIKLKLESNVKSDKIAIWCIEKGVMPLNGQKVKVSKTPAKKVEDDAPSRVLLAKKFESRFDRGNKHVYLEYMAVLMTIIKDEDKSLYNALTFIVDPSPIVSFYLLVEPYKDSNYIIPGYILKKVSSKLPNALRSWKSCFKTPEHYNDMKSIIQEISEDITSDVGSKGQLEKIKLAYDTFANEGGIFPMLPIEAQRFYKQNQGIKLWQDGARHLLRKAFDGDAVDRDNVIARMFEQYVSGDMNTIVTDIRFYKKSGSLAVYEGLAGEFIQSELLMYIPRSPVANGDDIISSTWEELESRTKEYTTIDDDIIRQLRDMSENDPARFERIMKTFAKPEKSEKLEKPDNTKSI